MVQQLIPAGDFLKLSLANPDGLAPFLFTLNNGITGQVLDSGVICFEPVGPTIEDVVLSCGVHGNETAPIEICAAIVQDILTEQLIPQVRLLVLFGNPPAINAGSREIDENLNRLFSGQHSKGAGLINAERRRAKALEDYVSQFFLRLPVTDTATRNRSLYDLHTAIRGSRFEKFAVCPYLHGKPWRQAEFAFLAACDVYTVLLMQTPATTFSYYASHTHGANSFTIELGKVQAFGQNDMVRFSRADASLRALIRAEPVKAGKFESDQFNMYQVYRSIIKQTQDFKLHFANDIENFTSYPPGTLLATDGDTEYRVEQEGEALIFPNANVAIGQRAMLMVIPASVSGNLQ